MKRAILITLLFLFLFPNHLSAQKVETDSIKISTNNCATKLVKDYFRKSVEKSFRCFELIKSTGFEMEENGVFIISTLSSHSKKLIVLKKENQVKFLGFSSTSNSLIELISFLLDVKANDNEVEQYLSAVLTYLNSLNSIRFNEVNDSTWLECK
jgi:hypothetical protein